LHAAAPGQPIGNQPLVFVLARQRDAGVVVGQRIAWRGQRFLVGAAAEVEVDFGLDVAEATGILDALVRVRDGLFG